MAASEMQGEVRLSTRHESGCEETRAGRIFGQVYASSQPQKRSELTVTGPTTRTRERQGRASAQASVLLLCNSQDTPSRTPPAKACFRRAQARLEHRDFAGTPHPTAMSPHASIDAVVDVCSLQSILAADAARRNYLSACLVPIAPAYPFHYSHHHHTSPRPAVPALFADRRWLILIAHCEAATTSRILPYL